MVVIWNPSIGKSFSIPAPGYLNDYRTDYSFGVCPVTKDPTLVKIKHRTGTPWHVEVFTLSSCVWNVIPSSNILFESIRIDLKTHPKTQVVIDRFIYSGACEKTFVDDGRSVINHMIVSFDLITKEFKVVDLPDSLRNELDGAHVSVAKLRESLIVYVNGAECCGVWAMEQDSSFRKLFTIGVRVSKIWGLVRVVKLYLKFERRAYCLSVPHYMFTTPAHNKSRILGFRKCMAHSSWDLTRNRYFYLITRTQIYIYIRTIIDHIDNDHISRLGFTKWMLP
ncbi:probable galacturonosyltransferase 7 isoform X2 [Tanacetum coccineum]